MIERFINKDLTGVSTLELAEIVAISTGVLAVYRSRGLDAADVLGLHDKASSLFAERTEEELMLRRARVLQRLDALQTPAEKRKQAEEELSAIDGLLKKG